jgi:hypothetical protein
MNKQYYFLAGLHRSGNTVLSSILNQNPDIYSSPNSPVVEYMWQSHLINLNSEISKTNTNPERSINVVSKIIENYYSDVKKPIIFDRSKSWANPGNINLIKTYCNFIPKIIYTTRPILEILASHIAILKNILIDEMNLSEYTYDNNLTQNENICDYLMSDYSRFKKSMCAFDSIDDPNNNSIIHVVKYQDLLDSPQKTMNNIYSFLELQNFNHDFNNIEKIEKYNESAAGLPENLHSVRKVLGKGNIRIQDHLSSYTIEKYKDAKYF